MGFVPSENETVYRAKGWQETKLNCIRKRWVIRLNYRALRRHPKGPREKQLKGGFTVQHNLNQLTRTTALSSSNDHAKTLTFRPSPEPSQSNKHYKNLHSQIQRLSVSSKKILPRSPKGVSCYRYSRFSIGLFNHIASNARVKYVIREQAKRYGFGKLSYLRQRRNTNIWQNSTVSRYVQYLQISGSSPQSYQKMALFWYSQIRNEY
jgi:hypothetical protein